VFLDEDNEKAIIQLDIRNASDELAKDVGIELPTFRENHSIAAVLQPQQKERFEIEKSFSDLGIRKNGRYSILARALYKDKDGYPFSAPIIVPIEKLPLATKSLEIIVSELGKEPLPNLIGSRSFDIVLRNNGPHVLEIEKIQAFTSREIKSELAGKKLGINLEPESEQKAVLTFEDQGAILGSVYLVSIVAEGVSIEGHFSEEKSFMIRIHESFWTLQSVLALLLILAAIAILVRRLLKKRLPPTS
jgi:hypothetical protein